MNLPPRLGELRLWAMRLHLYGDDDEDAKLLSASNQLLAGLPLSTEEISAEEQLMFLGMAKTASDAAALVAAGTPANSGLAHFSDTHDLTGERPPPQLYPAPDPDEDPEAQRSMEQLATLAVQTQSAVAAGNLLWNATRTVLNATQDFFRYGVLPGGGLDALDDFLLKKLGLISHCGVGEQMMLRHAHPAVESMCNSSDTCSADSLESNSTVKEGVYNDSSFSFSPISKELMCGMRVHLLSENETHIFCPAAAKVWEDNCQEVQFANYTAISESNEMMVIEAFRSIVHQMLSGYPNTIEEDEEIMNTSFESDVGPMMISAVRLRLREKLLLKEVLSFLDDHEQAVRNSSVIFQLEQRKIEREAADNRLEAHKQFIDEIKRKASERESLASISVNLSGKLLNLTLEEGADLLQTVADFCEVHNVHRENIPQLQSLLKAKVRPPVPLALLLGVVVPHGGRHILGVIEGSNSTIETGVFCERHHIPQEDCERLQRRVVTRLHPLYPRRLLASLTADAPDSRRLQFIMKEGEQHDVRQYVSDFFQYYKMPPVSIDLMTSEVYKRLEPAVLKIPVSLPRQRQVEMRLAANENITTVVSGFMDFFEINETARSQLMRMALHGMAPGSFLI